ncbi:MAG: hypothetical protein M1836_003106 [Candelina mexicana]|nr:MAG: hypothetical protein M1836_003106 [Candelina mexicana]
MSSPVFIISEHIIPCEHIREYPRATSERQEDVLRLAVKQYTPLNNQHPKAGDVTIVGAHANGFPKECYEPLWEEILRQSTAKGIRIRGIWMADVAHQGASGVLNEHIIGDDPSWHDHPRDLLQMINIFRKEMPRPLVGVGHSMGATQLVNLSLIHPRLLSTLVLLEPVLQQFDSSGPSLAHMSALRRDLWPSRADAMAAFRKNKFYQRWDERALTQFLTFGLRELPTLIYPANSISQARQPMVTLKTTKHQEVFSYQRMSPRGVDKEGNTVVDRRNHPDIDFPISSRQTFYRPEVTAILRQLPSLRPSTLYIFGGESFLSTPILRKEKMEITGTGMGGSGGEKEGRVKEVVFENNGHLVAMEAVEACAEVATAWLQRELETFAKDEELLSQYKNRQKKDKVMISDEWKELLGGKRLQGKEMDKGKL